MKISQALIEAHSMSVAHYFRSMNELYQYYINNSLELVEGIYCAVGDVESVESVGYYDSVWTLELYDGQNWLEVIPDTDYSLVITNDGLAALTDALAGGYRLLLSEIKMLSNNVRDETVSNPLIFWNDQTFTLNHDVVFKLRSTNIEDDPTDYVTEWRNHVSYNTNLTTSGLQICVKLLPSDLSILNDATFTIQTIGLYVQDMRLNGNGESILFGVVALPSGIVKTVDIQGFGNELTFYINTVLSNLGTVLDLQVNRLDCSSLPEVSSELDLPTAENGITDNYNTYLVQNVNGSESPALAIKQFNGADNSITWRYITPSDNSITVGMDAFDSSVENYMFVYYNTNTGKYGKADGTPSSGKQVLGMRVGSSIVFAGTVYNLATLYSKRYTLSVDPDNLGTNYNVGDVLIVESNTTTNFTVRVLSVGNNGEILSISYSPMLGQEEINFIRAESYYKIYNQPGVGGTGAKFNCTTVPMLADDWKVYNVSGPSTGEPLSNFINQPLYVGTGTHAGQLTTDPNSSFVGWALTGSSIRLGLDARVYATTDEYGIVKYATDTQVKQKSNLALATTPKHLGDNYIISNSNCYVGSSQNSENNRATVSSYLSFDHAIISNMPSTENSGVAFQGTAYRALWGDLAEYYRSDKYYPAGSLIIFGAGHSEITLATTECDGVISERPGFILGEKNSDLDLPVALSGKVPVLFDNLCAVHCGDKVYLSREVPGKASTKENGKCIGRVIDTDPTGKVKIMCVVNIKF